ncbi:MAG: hypothetical protein AAF757_15780 [Cyanobacteria bacterium P01_D01_bin.116]
MSKFVSAISGLMTVGAIVGYFNAKDASNQKFNLHLGLITTGLTIGAVASELSNGIEVKRKIKNAEDKFTREIKALTKEKDDYLSQNKQFSSLFMDKDSNVKQLNEQLQKKEQEVSSLKQGYQLLEIATKHKIAELDAKIARDDDRQDKFIEEIKRGFAESLKNKIDYEYERIADTTVHRLNDKRFEDIHPVLERFYHNLKLNHNNHYVELQDIYSLEGDDVIQEVIDTYFRISMEISSLHVKLRNLLNTTTKLTLEVFRDELIERRDPSKFVARDKVKEGLNHFQTETKVKVDKVRQSAIENNAQLQELREEVDNFLNEIEQKNLEIADLKEKLVRPMFWNLANSRELEIGNLIIKYFWKNGKGIYLDRSYIETDGYNLTLYFQTDRNPRAIIEKELNEHSESLQQYCRVIKPIVFSYDGAKGLMTAKVVLREKPKIEPSKDDIYKFGLIPASQFCDTVAKATDHKKKGKPTLRVMAATGEGKGIAVKNLLAYFADIEGWEIWLSDPVDGSEEDHWDTPKIATNASYAGKAYDLFLRLHKERKDLKQPGFTDRSVLGVFDEFDKQHSKEDKEQAKQIMTAIRHSNQRQILIGQCAEVGSNGWAWDDMKNCSLLVLGTSIGSLVKHLRQDFGWTTKKVNQVKREYEKFSTWADNLNVANPDIPNENQTRIGLLVVGDKYQFLELPIAHKGILKDGKAVFRTSLTATPLSTNTQKYVSTNSNSTPFVEASKPVSEDNKELIKCPKCESTNIGTKGTQFWRCKDCGKSWKKK